MRDTVSKEWWMVPGSDGTNWNSWTYKETSKLRMDGVCVCMCLRTRGQPRGLILRHLEFFESVS